MDIRRSLLAIVLASATMMIAPAAFAARQDAPAEQTQSPPPAAQEEHQEHPVANAVRQDAHEVKEAIRHDAHATGRAIHRTAHWRRYHRCTRYWHHHCTRWVRRH